MATSIPIEMRDIYEWSHPLMAVVGVVLMEFGDFVRVNAAAAIAVAVVAAPTVAAASSSAHRSRAKSMCRPSAARSGFGPTNDGRERTSDSTNP